MASSATSLIYEHNAAPIGRHLERDDVTELVINQPGWVGLETRNGWEWHEEPALDNAALMTLAKLIAGLTKQDINSEYPIVSSVLPGGERAQVVVPPAVEQGFVSITIRKASGVSMNIDDFERAGLFSEVRFVRGMDGHLLDQANDPADRQVGIMSRALRSETNCPKPTVFGQVRSATHFRGSRVPAIPVRKALSNNLPVGVQKRPSAMTNSTPEIPEIEQR